MFDTRVLIVDDEPLARRVIRDLLAPHHDVTVVGECRDGNEAVAAIHALAPTLVFLDVQMPELDGFGVLRALHADMLPAVIMVTAYDEFAVRAFDEQALDYLVKPFTDQRFLATLARARRHLAREEAMSLAGRLMAVSEKNASTAVSRKTPLQRILATVGARSVTIPVATIDWISADDYYARLHVGNTSYLVRHSLSALESSLDTESFVRIHRSTMVNIQRIREVRHHSDGRHELALTNGKLLPISERKWPAVAERLGKFSRHGEPRSLP